MHAGNVAAIGFTLSGVLALVHGVSMPRGLIVCPWFAGGAGAPLFATGAVYGLAVVVVPAFGVFLVVRRFHLASALSLDADEPGAGEASGWGLARAFSRVGAYVVDGHRIASWWRRRVGGSAPDNKPRRSSS